MPDGSEIERDAPAEDPLPWLALRVREAPDGKKFVEVMHQDFVLGRLPSQGWALEGGPERYGTLTVKLTVETADIYAGEFRVEPAAPAALRAAALREGGTHG